MEKFVKKLNIIYIFLYYYYYYLEYIVLRIFLLDLDQKFLHNFLFYNSQYSQL